MMMNSSSAVPSGESSSQNLNGASNGSSAGGYMEQPLYVYGNMYGVQSPYLMPQMPYYQQQQQYMQWMASAQRGFQVSPQVMQQQVHSHTGQLPQRAVSAATPLGAASHVSNSQGASKSSNVQGRAKLEQITERLLSYHLGAPASPVFTELIVEKFELLYPGQIPSSSASASKANHGKKKLMNAAVAKKNVSPPSNGSSEAPFHSAASAAPSASAVKGEEEKKHGQGVGAMTGGSESSSTEEEVLVARLSEVLARYVQDVMRAMDQWVPAYTDQRQHGVNHVVQQREQCHNFFYCFFEQLAANVSERGCGRYLVVKVTEWLLQHGESDLMLLVENPAARIARFIDGLNLMTASIAKSAICHYVKAGHLTSDVLPLVADEGGMEEAKLGFAQQLSLLRNLTCFFHHFAVDINSGDMQLCVSEKDKAFQDSSFRIYLVDDFGSLHNLLYQLGKLKVPTADQESAIGVDFEGVRLSRHGAMTLAQFCLSSDPKSVYCVDVTRLQGHAFHTPTHTGCSIKSVLEDPNIRKIFYDPRHDTDALFHQFRVEAQGVFDLQIAEVALRRARGLTVRYVQGLFRCLNSQQGILGEQQKYFAERINDIGKSLFEPEHGGDYEILRSRPLHPSILMYASHDARYLLPLFEQFSQQLSAAGDSWFERVSEVSSQRAQWYMHPEYVLPTTEAPEI